ncbi:hypothetical protein D4R87_00290 [bacterium]|nr:MAG: hypothetical protein D4R87_00290 [bacterium]
MDLKELLDFIAWENNRVNKTILKDYSKKEIIFFRVVKAMEEFGELCNEIIALNGAHRKGKQKKFKKDDLSNLSKEFADVILTALLVGDALNIDIKKALEDRIKNIKERKY